MASSSHPSFVATFGPDEAPGSFTVDAKPFMRTRIRSCMVQIQGFSPRGEADPAARRKLDTKDAPTIGQTWARCTFLIDAEFEVFDPRGH